MIRGSLLACMLWWLISEPSRAETLLVNANGTGQYPTIQAAIDAAIDGDEVHLAAGTYTGDGNRDVDFQGKAITVRSQSGDPASVTLSPLEAWLLVNRAFILASGEGPSTVIEGLTVSAAYTEEHPSSRGVVRCEGSSPTVRNCVFYQVYGTAIWSSGGAPIIESCSFTENQSVESPAAIAAPSGHVTVRDCMFLRNGNDSSGGALYFHSGHVSHCTFVESTAYFQGGAIAMASGIVEDCSFRDGGATYSGGAISTWGSAEIRRCDFVGMAGEQGGAIRIGGDSVSLIDACTFVSVWGRARGEAILVDSGGHTEITNTIIAFGRDSAPCTGCGAVVAGPGASIAISCSNFFGNTGGDWAGQLAPFLGVDGNISADPLFCDAADGDYTLYGSSPCAPANSGGCGLIGAFPVGCGPVSVEARSWGKLKGMYR